MKKILLALALSAISLGSLAEEENCNHYPSEQKFSCIYYEFWTQKSMRILVDLPSGFGCDQAPESGTITYVNSGKSFKIYEPRVTTFYLDGGVPLEKITHRVSDDPADRKEIYCTDMKHE